MLGVVIESDFVLKNVDFFLFYQDIPHLFYNGCFFIFYSVENKTSKE